MPDDVVLLHGMARRPSSMRPMGRALEAAGFAVLNVGYDSRRKSLDHLGEDVRRKVAGFAATRAGPVHFVTTRWAASWRAPPWHAISRSGWDGW